MKGRNLAVIVAALRPRSGVSLLTRVLADYVILSHERPVIFDTDHEERRLASYFPHLTTVVDLNRVQGQMTLFDTLASAVPEKRLVDVAHRAFQKFFDLMHDIDYVAEARPRHIEPIIFYIVGRDFECYEHGRLLCERFDCPVVMVENAVLGEPRPDALRSRLHAALARYPWRMHMAPLDPLAADMIADPRLSLAAFMRQDVAGLAYLSRDCRSSLRAWIMKMFKEIHRVTNAIAAVTHAPLDGAVGS
jgi:hypothetical protein